MYLVRLKKGKESHALAQSWVYANEVASVEGKDKQGSIAKVVSYDDKLVGYGFINHLSKIFIRFVSRSEESFDKSFFADKISKAIERRRLLSDDDAVRLVFGESDDIPGLIVDQYGEYLSVQFLCLGIDKIKQWIIEILVELLNPNGIYERSDSPIRLKEGLEPTSSVLYGEVPEKVYFKENGLTICTSIIDGQKTGYFLDQKANRERFGRFAKGKTVLDCFCNAGGFALNAAKNGAKSVTAVDISQSALNLVKHNAELNSLLIETEKGDVFELLREYKKQGRKFDLICLDPPAFIKTADTVKSGYSGYRDINVLALKLLDKNGILFTCSCSQHMTMELFFNMLKESARYSNSDVSLLEFSIQNVDHACKITQDEALYLKAAALRKNN